LCAISRLAGGRGRQGVAKNFLYFGSCGDSEAQRKIHIAMLLLLLLLLRCLRLILLWLLVLVVVVLFFRS
jgi:hypothetical protein